LVKRKGKKKARKKELTRTWIQIPKLKLPVLFPAILVLALASCVTISYFVFSKYASLELNNETTWDGEAKQNILFAGMDRKENSYKFVDLLAVITIDPKTDTVGVFVLDPDIQISMEDGTKTTLRKSYNLEIGQRRGMQNIIFGVEQVLAIEIDKHAALDEETFFELEGFLDNFKGEVPADIIEPEYLLDGEPFEMAKGNRGFSNKEVLGAVSADEAGIDNKLGLQTSIIRNYIAGIDNIEHVIKVILNLPKFSKVETNFSKTELVKLYYFFSGLNSADIRVGFTRQSSLQAADTQAGIGKAMLVENIDKDVQSIFLDANVAKEQVRLEVLNGTEMAGLAGKYSRSFDNSGIRVVRTGNAISQSRETILFVENPDDYSNTIEQIKIVFDGKIKIIEEEYKYKHIGNVVLVVGKDSLEE